MMIIIIINEENVKTKGIAYDLVPWVIIVFFLNHFMNKNIAFICLSVVTDIFTRVH